ncbi:MAG: hypothetical protein H3C71_05500, partial [Flavobacteriales bacterium]|nr:hypothetical protein [Flavobacteriales bacterium]
MKKMIGTFLTALAGGLVSIGIYTWTSPTEKHPIYYAEPPSLQHHVNTDIT